MSFNRTVFDPKDTIPNVRRVVTRWTGGGAATDMTRTKGFGIKSIAYNSATGAYIITFLHVGEVFLGGKMTVLAAGTTAAAKVANPVAYNATNKTLTIFIVDVATPTAKDLTTSEELWCDFAWADTDGPS